MRLQSASATHSPTFLNLVASRLTVRHSGPLAALLLVLLFASNALTGCGGGWSGLGPKLTATPASQTVLAGQPVSFSVTASGTAPFTYQWQRNGGPIAGATASTYTLPTTAWPDNGSTFAVTVENMDGSVKTPVAMLTVNAPPSLTTAPSSQTIVAGQAAVLTVQAVGTQPMAIQWFRNGVALPGATTPTFTSAAMTAADSGAGFSATVTNAVGSVTSPMALVTVNAPPAWVAAPVAQTVNVGQTASFSVVVSGTQPISYQWARNGAALAGATGPTYVTPTLAATDTGAAFTVSATNAAGTINSPAALLTVNAPPTLVTAPLSETIVAGKPVSFSVGVSGTAPFTYQWFKNAVAIPGATAASYTYPAVQAADQGTIFTASVSNAAGSITTPPATLTVDTAPVITMAPASATVFAGQAASFAVTATGTAPFTYQWFKNGTSIAGATSAAYTTPALSTNDGGAAFSVAVSNAAGTVTSPAAGVTVNGPPTLATMPVSQTVVAPTAATFAVAASANCSGPLSYQWSRNGAPIAGATAASYTTAATASGDNGAAFTVTVSNGAGSVTSAAGILTVNTMPVITAQPVAATVNAPDSATFSVTASGSGVLTYQWSRNGSPIAGATVPTYTTAATASTDNAAVFTVTVSNASGSATSSPAALTVNSAPVMTLQPVSQTVTAPAVTTFTATATGTGPLSYQWSRNGSAIGGATGRSYTTPATSGSDSGAFFTLTVTNAAGAVTSSPATLTVNTPPGITAQPTSVAVTAGQPASFSVAATGMAPLSYQWFRGGAAIAGATGTSYTLAATTAADNGAIYTVAVTNPVGTVTSGPANMTVNTPPSITAQPVASTVALGQTASFSVAASGTGPLTYQWFRAGSAIPGATGSTYSTTATVASDSGAVFTVTVTNAVSAVTSSAATLTVNLPPTITQQPFAQTMNVGEDGVFSVAVTGTAPFTYQWFKNGAAIAGATAATYSTPALVAGDNGAAFTVAISNAASTVTSTQAVLTVIGGPTLSQQPVSTTVNAGQPASFSAVVSNTVNAGGSSFNYVYQWFRNGSYIPGATTASYTIPATTAADNAAVFYVIVADSAGSVTSSSATLTVNVAPSLLSQPQSQTVNVGQAATFSVTASGLAPYTWQWFKNGAAIAGATASGYTTPALTANDNNALYTVAVSNVAGTTTSSPAIVTLDASPSIVGQPSSTSVNLGQPASFTVSATGDNHLVYQWFRNGSYIPGATGRSYTSPATILADNNATFYVVVADQAGSVTSSTATLSLIQPPVITAQPVSQNVCSAANVTLSVGSNYGTTYQWSLNGTALAGATGSSYFIASALNPNDAGNYTVIVADAAGSVASQPATINVGSSVTSNPMARNVSATQTATFSVAASGKAPFSYQWYVVSNGGPASAIAGATGASYTTPAVTTSANGNQYYATVTDSCGSVLTSAQAALAVNNNAVPPTITSQPLGQQVAAGSTPTLTVGASGTPSLTYQWFTVPAGQTTGQSIAGATAASYTLPASATHDANDQDAYYVIVANQQGQAVSQRATLAVDGGILVQIANQPANQYVNAGAPASFTVTASSTLPLSYQWYSAAPGTASFSAIPGATGSTYTVPAADLSQSGSVVYVVVSNGSTTAVSSSSASLFVGPLNPIGDLCQTPWTAIGNATLQTAGAACSYQLTAATNNQQGEIVWPNLIATANLQLAFTVTMSDPSNPPADGFAVVLGDPSLGATPTSTGAAGEGLGAKGIPGFVLGFDTYQNGSPDAATVPYLGITRGETALWEDPWFNINTAIPALVAVGQTISHDYVVTLVNGQMSVTMDGNQVFSGAVTVPSTAYLYVTSSTGGKYEQTVISNLSAVVSTPAN